MGVSPLWVGLAFPTGICFLPFLRTHGLILVVPPLILLLLKLVFERARLSRILAMAQAVLVALALAFGLWIYGGLRGEAHVPAAVLQVRSGLEMRYHKTYETNEKLWDDYAKFAEHGRAASIFDDYGTKEIATHVASNLWDYLRRAPIVLALALWIPCLLLRRQIPHGVSILCLWVCLYCLALSPAYYTERAAALPLLVALPLVPLLGRAMRQIAVKTQNEAEQSEGPLMLLVMLLLILGIAWQGKTAWQDFQTRSYYARASRELDFVLQKRGIARERVMVYNWRLLPLRDNPWCEPYRNVYGSWLDDPAIPLALRAGIPPKLSNRVKVDGMSQLEQGNITHLVFVDWPSEEGLARSGGDFKVNVETVQPYFLLIQPESALAGSSGLKTE